jgi:hypothetical protein
MQNKLKSQINALDVVLQNEICITKTLQEQSAAYIAAHYKKANLVKQLIKCSTTPK